MNVLTYEQLKQRLDAVVAECARVKLIAKDLASEAAQTAGEYDDLCAEIDAETPSVTAALAEVEARGVERFANEYLRETAKEHSAEGKDLMALRFISFANMADGFAAHLRNPPYQAVELREGRA